MLNTLITAVYTCTRRKRHPIIACASGIGSFIMAGARAYYTIVGVLIMQ